MRTKPRRKRANKFKEKVETGCQASGIASGTRSKAKQEPCQTHLQDFFPPAHSITSPTGVSQEIVSFGPRTFTKTLHAPLKYSSAHENDLASEDQDRPDQKMSSTTVDRAKGLDRERICPPGEYELYEEVNSECFTTCLLEETIEQERVKLKNLGYMSDSDPNNGRVSNDSWLNALHHTAVKTAAACTSPEQEQDNLSATDTCTEQGAALLWPKHKKKCRICRVCHVAIPKSGMSRDCIRISISVGNATAPESEQTHHQSVLIPTDMYERSVLGWLIRSTFEHQVALRNAAIGAPQGKAHPDDYILTEIFRNDKKKARSQKHRLRSTLQSWWEGRRNLVRWIGKRWLVVTFPWDMGDPNMFNASFGTLGHLFRFPKIESTRSTEGEIFTSEDIKTFGVEGMADCRLSKDEEEVAFNDGNAEDSQDDKGAREKLDGINKCRENLRDFTADCAQRVTQPREPDRMNPAFHLYRDDPSSSSDRSSQGSDDDFM